MSIEKKSQKSSIKKQNDFLCQNAIDTYDESTAYNVMETKSPEKGPKKCPEKRVCEKCDFVCNKISEWNRHCLTKKHNLETYCKQEKSYTCEMCDFSCSKFSKFKIHTETRKHKKKCESNDTLYICQICESIYKSRSGLWKHKQKCGSNKDDETSFFVADSEPDYDSVCEETEDNLATRNNNNNIITPELIMLLIQQNKEMQQAMIEMAKNMGNNNTNNSHNTTNNIQNKSFNLNVFLNETCKDAMNMSDFLNRLDVTTYDFEQTGKNGYVEGMCRILENGLNNLEVHERPIHCTDAKRETIYIKDNDKWEKDDDKKTKLVSVIKQVGAKNIKMIPQWCKEHPGWHDPDSKENDRYLKYVNNSMCGGTDEEIQKNYGDIARYISKITVVDKKEAILL